MKSAKTIPNKYYFIICILLCIATLNIHADDVESALPDEIEEIEETQTIFTEIEIETETDSDTATLYEFSLPKNPTKAALLSAFIPGAGQYYNEKYIKAPLVIAIQTSLVLTTLRYDKKFKDAKTKMKNTEGIEQEHYKLKYIEAYDSRQSFLFWVGASVLLSTMDAYVDAHLLNFKTKKNEIHILFENDKVVVSYRF